MLTAQKRALDPNAPVDPNALQQGGDDLTASMGAGTDAAPASPQVPLQTSATPAASGPAPTGRTDATPSIPTNGTAVGGITQLPDGAGGAVTVPPLALAPSSTTATTAMPQATDTTPWMTASAPTASAPVPGTFDESNNLINTQITPALDPRTAKLQGMQDQSLDKIANGPNRLDLAKRYWDDFVNSTQGDYAHSLTDATNHAAEHGYLGSGRLTNRYGDLEQQRENALTTAKSSFLNHALEGTIGDNQNLFQDTSAAASTAYNQGANARNETRSERDYQRSLAEQAIMRRIQQAAAEQGLSQQDFDNAMRIYGVGNANNPTGAYQDAAAIASGEAAGNSASVADLIRMLAARRAPTAGV